MKNIITYLKESLINEDNVRFYPSDYAHNTKFFLYYGENEYDHVQTRMYERNITEHDIINTFKLAYNELNKSYKDKKLYYYNECDDENKYKNQFTIFNNKLNITISAYLYDNKGIGKLYKPIFIIKTVYHNTNFKPYKNDLIFKI